MSFDPVPGPVSTGQEPAPIARRASAAAEVVVETVAEIRKAAADVISDVNAAQNISALVNDPKGWATDQLKSMGEETVQDALRAGLALVTDKVFCSSNWQSPECRDAAKIAAEVIDTTPGFSGMRERIKTIREGLTGFVNEKLDQLASDMRQLNPGNR